jgi:hypothetical protein
MANASIAQAVNRQTVAQALQQARIQAAEHQAWLNAINRAALFLAAERWAFDGETLIIQSATTEGTSYTATPHTCECRAFKAGRPCWHRAGARLLVKAAEVNAQPVAAPQRSYAEIQAAADALFA